MRKVGEESSKTWIEKHTNKRLPSFFELYMSGFGLDIGFAGYNEGTQPILSSATGVDLNYKDYDGRNLPFANNSQSYVYSSHCLEHIQDYKQAIQEWFRVTEIGGHIITVVPHKFLYEKKNSPPSHFNGDHKRFYTPASLLAEFEESLEPNSYRVRLVEDGDKDFDYNLGPGKHSGGQYEITLVIQKIKKPDWSLA